MPETTSELEPSSPAPETAAPLDKSAKSALLIVFLVVFVDLLGFGIVLPLLPLYGDSYVKAIIPGGKDSAAGGAIVGLLMSSFSMMQFLFAPVWGRISDRVGRRPILLLGLVGTVVSYLLFGYASELSPETSARLALVLLFVSRIGAGIAGATIATAQAVIADCTPPEKRKVGMALIGAAFGIGFTFGPLVGALSLVVVPEHHGVTGLAASGLSLLALILGSILLPETRRFGTAPPTKRRWLDWSALRMALSDSGLAPVVLTFFLATLGFASFEVTLALLNKNALYLTEESSFLVFAYVGLVLMLTQGVLYRRLAPRMSEATFMAIGIVLMGLGVISLAGVSLAANAGSLDPARWSILSVSPSPRTVAGAAMGLPAPLGIERPPYLLGCAMASLALAVVGFAFVTPSAQALISRRADEHRQGEILGVNQSASALARILGPILGLTLYELSATHMLPYLFGGGLLLLMLPLIPRIRRG